MPYTYDTVPPSVRHVLDDVIARARKEPGLKTMTYRGGQAYAYATGDQIAFGINGTNGINIFRGTTDVKAEVTEAGRLEGTGSQGAPGDVRRDGPFAEA